MKTNVISVINFKGGVGKTTVTFNLSSELAFMGYKVLMIDFDGQGNLTTNTGAYSVGDKQNIITVLDKILEGQEIEKDPIINLKENLDIITCDIHKESWSNKALSVIARETLLKRYIDRLKELYEYDYIFIDNAPSINLDFQNSLVASNYYLLVTEMASRSADGMEKVYDIIRQVNEYYNNNLKQAGIIINKVEFRTNIHSHIYDEMKGAWKEDIYIFKSFIPKSILAVESEYTCRAIRDSKSDSKIAEAYTSLAEEFIKRTK